MSRKRPKLVSTRRIPQSPYIQPKKAVEQFLDLDAEVSDGGSSDEPSEDEGFLGDLRLDDRDADNIGEEDLYPYLGFSPRDFQEEQEDREFIEWAKARASKRELPQAPNARSKDFAKALDILTTEAEYWQLKVKLYTEAHLAEKLNEEYTTLRSKEVPGKDGEIHLFSFKACCVNDLRGRIFVETSDMMTAARRLQPYVADKTVFNNMSRIYVENEDYSDVQQYFCNTKKRKVQAYDWVRLLNKGPYRRDLALVTSPRFKNRPDHCTVVVVPRFDISAYLDTLPGMEEKAARAATACKPSPENTKKRKKTRVPPQIIPQDIYEHMEPKASGCHYRWKGRTFVDGLELLHPHFDALEYFPTVHDEEVQPFSKCMLSARAAQLYIRRSKQGNWRLGSQVRVLKGQYAGATGSIEEVVHSDRTVTVALHDFRDPTPPFATVPWDHIRQEFVVGNEVSVAWGINRGIHGTVVGPTDDRGAVDIWFPDTDREVNKSDSDPHRMKSKKDEKAQEQEAEKERYAFKSAEKQSETIPVLQDYLVEYTWDVSFVGVRHHYAPGTVTSTVTSYTHKHELAEEGRGSYGHKTGDEQDVFYANELGDEYRVQDPRRVKERELEAAYRYLSHPQKGVVAPAPIPAYRQLFMTGSRESGPEFRTKHGDFFSLTQPKDHRIGKEAMIIGKDAVLKGRRGEILALGPLIVKIGLPGNNPPFVYVPRKQVVCLSEPNKTMDEKDLKAPLTFRTLERDECSAPPLRSGTPEPIAGPSNVQPHSSPDLAQGAFLLDPRIGLCDWHINVGIGIGHDQGRLDGRTGYTDKRPLRGAIEPAFDLHLGKEIVIHYKEGRAGAKLIETRVSVSNLRPVRPKGKDEEVVILADGTSYGERGVVKKLMKKQNQAEVMIRDSLDVETHQIEDLCKISTSPPY